MRPAEKELVALAGDRLKSTVLIAPHHGSRTSSSEEFSGGGGAAGGVHFLRRPGRDPGFHIPRSSNATRRQARSTLPDGPGRRLHQLRMATKSITKICFDSN